MNSNKHLLESIQLNKLFNLKNRIVMAPMTRAQALPDFSPTKIMAEYYSRRADAGLIITEGTVINPKATGHTNFPGIFTQKHIEQWRLVSKAIHANGGLAFMQIWHVGRVTHPYFINGEIPVSPSATVMSGHVYRSEGLEYGKARALTKAEIQDIIRDYQQAALNAIAAGFDGVEIHGANGYLIDQFLHHQTNQRQDEYGSSPENMARFALEVVKACAAAIGSERVGIRLSPGAYLNQIETDVRDSEVFKTLFHQLNTLPIAYVHVGNFDDNKTFPECEGLTMTAFIRAYYRGMVIASGGYSIEKAEAGIRETEFDLVSIGRPFIANPDLILRVQHDKPLIPYNASFLSTLH